jgi:DNA-binding Lrp family transcriptional regulator
MIEKFRMIDGVEKAELLFGDCDAVVKLNVPKIHDVENCVFEKIQMIEGTESTNTLLCVDEGSLE